MTIKIANMASKMAPLSRDILPSKHIIMSNTEATRAKGMSLRTVVRVMLMGVTMAATPTISRALKMFEPTMLPTARSGVPLSADTKLTQNSGSDVPMATMVSPMVSCDTLKRSAKATEPSVIRSAPQRTRMMPRTMNTVLSSILLDELMVMPSC